MSKTLTIDAIEKQIASDDKGKFDEVVQFGDIKFPDSEHIEVGGDGFVIQEAAKNHICSKLGIPASYWDRCPEKLRMQNLKYWYDQQDKNKEVLLRHRPKALRAMFSTNYTIFDNELVLHTIKETVPVAFNPTSFDLTEGSMLIRFTLPDTKKLVKEGDPLFVGFQIRTSEVGASSLFATSIIWRQICSNGMWGYGHDDFFNERHIFKSVEEMADNLKRAILNCVTADGKLLERFIKLQKKKLDVEIEKKALSERGIGKKTLELIEQSVEEPSIYGWVNAVTSVARELPMDRKLELERHAGQYLKAA